MGRRYDEPTSRRERFEVWLWDGYIPDWWERASIGFGLLFSITLASLIVAAIVAEHV